MDRSAAILALVQGKPTQPVVKKAGTPVAKSQAVSKKTFIDKEHAVSARGQSRAKKVTWPTRKQTMGSTVVVLVILLTIISLFLGLVDLRGFPA
jgi:preprotein translocase subunit SecE